MQTAAIRKAIIKRILDSFTRKDAPDLLQFVSGVNDASYPGIDDGSYGDPSKSTKPEFVQKDDAGWV